MKRREFIAGASVGMLMAGSADLLTTGVFAAAPKSNRIQYIRKDIPDLSFPPVRGRSYEATVPATLDLAERARISVEGVLTRQTDPQYDYEVYQQAIFQTKPALMYHSFHDFN